MANNMSPKSKHVVIDARIRRASTGRPVDRFLAYAQTSNTPHRFTVLTEPDDPWQPTSKQFTKRPIPYRQFSFNPLQQVGYARMLYSLKPDMVFFTLTGQQPLFYFGRQMTFTHDLTMLRFARAGKLPQWIHDIRMLGYKLLFWNGNKKARSIVVPSQFVQKDLAQNYSFTRDKTTVIYESAESKLASKSEHIANINQPFLLHIGSPFPHKNIERLIDAYERLATMHPKLQLVLAGKQEYYFRQLQNRIALSPVSKNITIPGFVQDSQIRWLYENCACYALPSLSEGFGLPGLEAMTYGAPLASSNATCLPEIFGDAALYFDPNSTDDMVTVINRLLTDQRLRTEIVQKGSKQIKKYSWHRMTQQILALIDANI